MDTLSHRGQLAPVIPACLQQFADQRRWVVWRWQERDGKRTKPPYQPNGMYASTTNPATWSTLAEVQAACAAGGFDGIGINMAGLDGIVGIDLDKVRDPSTGEPASPAIADLLNTCGSYAEVSPSGTGFRIFGKGELAKTLSEKAADGSGFEIYGSGDARYLTITGQQVTGTPDVLGDVMPLVGRLQTLAANKAAPDLPHDLQLRLSLCIGDRSAAFQGIANSLRNLGYTMDQAEDILRRYPNGPAGKYLENGRDDLRRELERSWAKASIPQVEPVRTSQFRSASDLAGKPVPPREWLVPNVVPMRNVTLLSGDGGTGKSLLALQLAISVACGKQWLGLPARAGRALFISAEDDEPELHYRMDEASRNLGVTFQDMGGLVYRSLAGEDALLALDDKLRLTATALYNEIDELAKQGGPKLIVLDTLADMYPANENDRAKVRQFIGLLRGLAVRHGCAVILLAHPSLTGINSGTGTSGSTGWSNSVRSRLYFQRIKDEDGQEPNTDARLLRVMKNNYGPVGNEFKLRFQDGAFVLDGSIQLQQGDGGRSHQERVFLRLLEEMEKQGRNVNANGGASYAPTLFSKLPDAEGITKHAFRGAMERLLASGQIINRSHNRSTRLVINPQGEE